MSNVPKLRFKEFSGEWNKNNVAIKILSGNTYPLNAYSKEGTLLVQGLNIYPNELQLDNPIYISDKHLTGKDVFVSKEDILVGLNRPIIGKKLKACLFLKDSAVLYQRAGILSFDKSKLSNRFLYQYLFAPSFIRQLLVELVGSDQPYIKSDLFKVTKNIFPSKQEQEKIALFLTSVDTKIQLLTKKEELLSSYKKGVMQKIFSGEITFKADDGSEFAPWEKKKLEELGVFKTSSVDKKIVDGEELVHLVNYMNVYKHENIDNEAVKGYMKVSAKDNQIETSDLRRGDILFTPSSETPDDIGHSVVIFEDLENAVYSYHLMRFRPKVTLDILYSHYFCNIPEVLQQITKVATGSTRFTISVGEFSKIAVNLPCLEEQTKIANFLSSIDSKIEQVQKQLNSTKEFKKALLQQMFV